MAYDEFLADRITQILHDEKADFFTKKMFGGLCFMVNDKMLCGIHYDKKKETDLLMARVGVEASQDVMNKDGAHPMDFTGRPMKGYVFVTPEGYDVEEDLTYWIRLCLQYNPLAKASKKKK